MTIVAQIEGFFLVFQGLSRHHAFCTLWKINFLSPTVLRVVLPVLVAAAPVGLLLLLRLFLCAAVGSALPGGGRGGLLVRAEEVLGRHGLYVGAVPPPLPLAAGVRAGDDGRGVGAADAAQAADAALLIVAGAEERGGGFLRRLRGSVVVA